MARPAGSGINDECGHASDLELSDEENESSKSEIDSMDHSDENEDDTDSGEDHSSDVTDKSNTESTRLSKIQIRNLRLSSRLLHPE